MTEEARQEGQSPHDPEEATGRGHRSPSRGQVRRGRKVRRDQSVVPESSLIAGRFGRMFRNLPSFEPGEATIDKCVEQLVEPTGAGEELDNPEIPAGFTYLGQFIDHDLTFDPVSSLERQNDPDGLRNFRTPRLDLDCVYGLGPADQPYLYQREDPAEQEGVDPAERKSPNKLLVGRGESAEEEDLPRNGDDEVALIGDPRNDENIIVSQLQLAFIKLHNQIVHDIIKEGKDGRPDLRLHLWSTGDVFREAQRLTRWHYQWVVLKEFLPKICGTAVMNELLEEIPVEGVGTRRQIKELEYYKPKELPFIPVEWSVAAYRYGHSQIRPDYVLNERLADIRKANEQKPGIDIFIENPDDANRLEHLAGGRKLPPIWTLDWRLFFEQNPPGTPEEKQKKPQKSRLIDTKLAGGLRFLPGTSDGHRFLARLNLERGRTMGLPSGQAVARRMSIKPLTPRQLGLQGEAPLWFYILKEAQLEPGNEGKHLGRVGGRIVAEVILGMLQEDPFSFLRTEPTWEPVLPAPISGSKERWGMADLLTYAIPNDGRRFSD